MTDKKHDAIAKPGTTDLEALIGQESGNLTQRPDFIEKGDKTGTDGITRDDLRFPRIAIAQGMSPQMSPSNAAFIKGLGMFDLFNDGLSKEVYGTGPLYFIPVRFDKRCIQFKPRSEGGGVINPDVPWNSKLATEWRDGVGPDGKPKRLPPLATRFYEWVVLLLKTGGAIEEVVLSIKPTNKHNTAAARALNGFIHMYANQGKNSVPIYGVIYSLSSKGESNGQVDYGVPVIGVRGFMPQTDLGRTWYQHAKEYAASLAGKSIEPAREPGDEPFIDADAGGDKPDM